MKLFLLLFLLALAACGARQSSRVDYGKTTVQALIAEKGEPLEEKSVPVKDGRVLLYEDNEKYQVKNDVVTHGFADPKGNEKSVLYWKHKFKECDTTLKKISQTKGHEIPEYELACPSEGTSVIYSEGSEFVTRVIQYEKK